MCGDTDKVEDEVQPPKGQLSPRLSIFHLMLWTATTSVAMVAFEQLTTWDEFDPTIHAFMRGVHLVYSMAYGGAGAWMCWMMTRLALRRPVPLSQPGHGLLLLVATTMIIDGVDTVVFRLLADFNGVTFYAYWEWHQSIGYGVAVIVGTVYFFALRLGWLVRSYILYLVTICVVLTTWNVLILGGFIYRWTTIGYYVPQHVLGGASMIGFIFLVISTIFDSLRAPRRDWLHWTGVGFWALITLIHSISYLNYVWIRSE